MRGACRVCGRALCGAQRRWLFHPAARLSLQALLSHALGRAVGRDGGGEFVCGRCAFVLERLHRFDAVIARVEALSLERLRRLRAEKERLKRGLAGAYRRTNGPGPDGPPDARYAALLREDFAFAGWESWTAPEEPQGRAGRGCRGCAALRVPDADYEAVCRVPRAAAAAAAGSSSSSRGSGNLCGDSPPPPPPPPGEPPSPDPPSADGAPAAEEQQQQQEAEAEAAEAEAAPGAEGAGGASSPGPSLEAALRLVRALGCKPVRSPRGSRLPVPVKQGAPGPQSWDPDGAAGCPEGTPGWALELSDLQELWEDLCADYVPLRTQNMFDTTQQLTYCDMPFSEEEMVLNHTEHMEKISSLNALNKQLQDKMNEMDFELKSVQHASKKQDHIIQKLKETLKSKENECEELNHLIHNQNEEIVKLQDMLHKNQLEKLQDSEDCSSLQQKQKAALLDAQNALSFTQLEVQQLKYAVQQKDRQLAEAQRSSCFLETALQEEQLQKEAAWRHNKEFFASLQHLKTSPQSKCVRCRTLEKGTALRMRRQDQKIKDLTYSLACKEWLLQESKDLLEYHQNLDKDSTAADKMVQKLQQLIKDKDAALEQAIREKLLALEDREQELNQLYLSIKEQDCDLKSLHQVISGNRATIQCLESLLKAKDLELEKLLAANQNLQWLIKNIEAKSHKWQSEQERIIQKLHDRNQEVEALSATLLCSLEPGQRDAVEALHSHLQQKDQILKELLRDKSRQAVDPVAELEELLQAWSAREQQSHIYSKKIAQVLIEKNSELQILNQQLISQILHQKMESPVVQRAQGEGCVDAPRQEDSPTDIPARISDRDGSQSRRDEDDMQTIARLEKELAKAKEELELLTQKERENTLKLSALQSVVASQEEELQVQSSDIESLTRSSQIKEELIKDLQMQLVDPEEIPAIERLTEEVLMLQEKVAKMEAQGPEAPGGRRQQLLAILEGLVAEEKQLNETLKVEKQLYGDLVKFHAGTDREEQSLQAELEKIQALRGQLEEVLGKSRERLSRLESLDSIGGGEPERVTILPKHAC